MLSLPVVVNNCDLKLVFKVLRCDKSLDKDDAVSPDEINVELAKSKLEKSAITDVCAFIGAARSAVLNVVISATANVCPCLSPASRLLKKLNRLAERLLEPLDHVEW